MLSLCLLGYAFAEGLEDAESFLLPTETTFSMMSLEPDQDVWYAMQFAYPPEGVSYFVYPLEPAPQLPALPTDFFSPDFFVPEE